MTSERTVVLPPRREILDEEIAQAREELERPARGLLLSGLIAGMAVGFGPLLGLAVETADGGVETSSLLRAHAYALGFVLAILARADLFTEYTTIAILPVLDGDARVRALARLWALILAANIVGAAVLGAAAAVIMPHRGVISMTTLTRAVAPLVESSPLVLTISASLSGWLMGLLSWLVVSSRETVSQLLFVYFTAFAIAVAHLHHVVSGAALLLIALFSGATVTTQDLLRFCGWATLGNAIGGTVFALQVRYSILKGQTTSSKSATT
jgi:formate-nitrite transporter family protein